MPTIDARTRWRWQDPLRRKALLVMAIPAVPLLTSALLLVLSVREEQRAQERVTHTLEVKADVSAALNLLADEESAVRGFVLTRGQGPLQRYADTSARWPALFTRLSSRTSDNETQRAHLRQIAASAAAQPFDRLLTYARTTDPGRSIPPDLLQQSGATTAAMRLELTEMAHEEDRLLAERATTAARAERQLMLATIASAAVGLGGALVAMFVFGALRARHLGQLDAVRGELDRFFSLSIDMLCISDFGGTFTRVNPAWEATLGWTTADLTSRPFVDFVHPDDVARTIAETAALTTGRDTVRFENRYRCADGSYRWLNWRATGSPDERLIYAAARDVTEEKHTAQELQARVAELAVVNHELEAFSYSVSHDLRAPLRHITGFASLLERHASHALDDTGRRYLTTITAAATKMGRLIDDLLTFSRIGRSSSTIRTVQLGELVEEVQADLRPETEGRDIAWTIRALPAVEGDPSMLRVVLTNLLSNAVKYTTPRRRAEIELGTLNEQPGEHVVYVRDNGVGFDPQYAGKLFGVFQRLHRSEDFDGTGIGLATVRRIVHRHGGRTWADGCVDGGATFYFSLPTSGDHLR